MRTNTPTAEVADIYHKKSVLLSWWEEQPADVQIREQEYITGLAQRVRKLRNYLIHRKDCPIQF